MKHPLSATAVPALAGWALALFIPLASAQQVPPVSEQEQVQRDAQDAQNLANEHAMAAKKPVVPKSFEELDRNKAGFLVLDDARRDTWLSQHFVQCDVDGNNQVSREEYRMCVEKQR